MLAASRHSRLVASLAAALFRAHLSTGSAWQQTRYCLFSGIVLHHGTLCLHHPPSHRSPPVIEEAHQVWAAAHPDLPIGDRIQLVGGDFFDSVPAADVYFLKHVRRGSWAGARWLLARGWSVSADARAGAVHMTTCCWCPVRWPLLTLLHDFMVQILHDWNDEDSIKV